MVRARYMGWLAVLALLGCIEEDSVPGPDASVSVDGGVSPDGATPDGAAPDGAVLPDGAVPDGAVVPDAAVDGGSVCDTPNPALGACVAHADCAQGWVCIADPSACVPSVCECDGGDWMCTADCGPGTVCVPGAACGDTVCGEGTLCVNDRCVSRVGPCERDFDCLQGYCEEAAGACVSVCEDEPSEIWCDALPPVCAVGEVVVAVDGCTTCVDARTCESGPGNVCWGAWIDETGACRAPNDGVHPAECCTLGGHALQHGRLLQVCGPDDGPALELNFGLGQLNCADPLAPGLRVVLWGGELERDALIDISDDTFGGFVQYCTAPGACEPVGEGQLYFDGRYEWNNGGRYWFTLPDGSTVMSGFTVESCGGAPMCG